MKFFGNMMTAMDPLPRKVHVCKYLHVFAYAVRLGD